jgi:hypothetical protein
MSKVVPFSGRGMGPDVRIDVEEEQKCWQEGGGNVQCQELSQSCVQSECGEHGRQSVDRIAERGAGQGSLVGRRQLNSFFIVLRMSGYFHKMFNFKGGANDFLYSVFTEGKC